MNRLQSLITLAMFIDRIAHEVENIHTLVPKETIDYVNTELVKVIDEISPKVIREDILNGIDFLFKSVKGE